ncbi:MAG: NAD-dependent protein deacylase [Actinomycetota bacterium]
MEEIEQAAGILAGASDVLVFTGAGVSEESGIPTFRGTGGIWERYRPTVYGTVPGLTAAFAFRRRKLAAFAVEALEAFVQAEPNPAHLAIAELERMGIVTAVATQNVDGLHQAAGSSRVLELHGSAYRVRCRRCGTRIQVPRERLARVVSDLEGSPSRRRMLAVLREYGEGCECGGGGRPDVVFFGESLPPGVFEEAAERASRCDLLLAVGTSGLVMPAAGIPLLAADSGAKVIEVNPLPSGLTRLADLFVPLAAGRALPAIVEAVKARSDRTPV